MKNSVANIPPRERGKRRKTNPWWYVLYVFIAIVIILLVLSILSVLGLIGYTGVKVNDAINEISTVEDGEPSGLPAPSAKEKPVSMLILGLDSRKETGSLNTDVIMVAVLNPETKKATIVSLPRDTLIEMDGYEKHKINWFYPNFKSMENRKKVEDGNEEMKKMMSGFLGIPIDYLTTINFQGFVDVVNTLGGIEIDVDMDMRYKDTADGTNIDLKKGLQTLNGEQALDFVRYRKSSSNVKHPTRESSDFERNQRQTKVLKEIVRKLQSFNAVMKIDEIFGAVGKNLKMDVPPSQIREMISTYYNINRDDIEYIPVPGTWKSPYVYLDEAEFAAAKEKLKQHYDTEALQ